MPYGNKPQRPSGAMWAREKKSDKSPDFSGYLEIEKEVLLDLIAKAKANQPIKMDVIAYKNRGIGNKEDWFRLIGSKNEPREAPRGARAPAPDPLDDEIPF